MWHHSSFTYWPGPGMIWKFLLTYLIGSAIISLLSITCIAIIYLLPSLDPTENLPVWYEYIMSMSSSRRSLILMDMYLCFLLGLVSVLTYFLSSGSSGSIFYITIPKGSSAYVLSVSLLMMESASEMSFPSGLAMMFSLLCLVVFRHVLLVGKPAAAW